MVKINEHELSIFGAGIAVPIILFIINKIMCKLCC